LPARQQVARIFSGADYASWTAFRESEDSRYVALTLPRVLARLPYGADFNQVDELNYEELTDGKDHGNYLWTSAAWAYGARITDAFAQFGWFVRTRGVEGGGKVEGLPVHTFPTDDGDVARKCPTEIAISDRREFELSNLGFLPLLHSKNRDFAVFMGAQSCQKPKQYFDPAANSNAEGMARIDYVLCASRFVHSLRIMARDLFAAGFTPQTTVERLNRWLASYRCTDDDSDDGDALSEVAKRPIGASSVQIVAGRSPGEHRHLVAFLQPAYQSDWPLRMQFTAEVPDDNFVPGAIDPAWPLQNDGAVVRVANAIRTDGRYGDLPILADALEEAGCTDERILGHCRDDVAGHVTGCWVVKAILGQSVPAPGPPKS
jgi:type VI secretion system protein ImpC